MVNVVRRLIYHQDEEVISCFESSNPQQKRAVAGPTLAAMLGLGVAAGIGTGEAALVLQSKLRDTYR